MADPINLFASSEGLDVAKPVDAVNLFAPDPNAPGPFKRGLKTGVADLKSIGGGLMQYAGRATGFGALENKGVEVQQNAATESAPYRMQVEDVGRAFDEGVGPGIGATADLVKYAVGNQIPMLATAAVGGVIGRVAAAGLGVTKVAAGLGAVENAVAVAKAARAADVGTSLGVFGSSVAMEAGQIAPEAFKTGEDHPLLKTAGGALVAGALDTVLPVYLARKLGLIGAAERVLAPRAAGFGAIAKDVGGTALKAGGFEGVQEGTQTYIERLAAGQPLTGDEANSAALNSTVMGAILGLVTGGVAGGVHAVRSPVTIDNATGQPVETPTPAATPETGTIDPNLGTPADELPPVAPATPEEIHAQLTAAHQQVTQQVATLEPAVVQAQTEHDALVAKRDALTAETKLEIGNRRPKNEILTERKAVAKQIAAAKAKVEELGGSLNQARSAVAEITPQLEAAQRLVVSEGSNSEIVPTGTIQDPGTVVPDVVVPDEGLNPAIAPKTDPLASTTIADPNAPVVPESEQITRAVTGVQQMMRDRGMLHDLPASKLASEMTPRELAIERQGGRGSVKGPNSAQMAAVEDHAMTVIEPMAAELAKAKTDTPGGQAKIAKAMVSAMRSVVSEAAKLPSVEAAQQYITDKLPNALKGHGVVMDAPDMAKAVSAAVGQAKTQYSKGAAETTLYHASPEFTSRDEARPLYVADTPEHAQSAAAIMAGRRGDTRPIQTTPIAVSIKNPLVLSSAEAKKMVPEGLAYMKPETAKKLVSMGYDAVWMQPTSGAVNPSERVLLPSASALGLDSHAALTQDEFDTLPEPAKYAAVDEFNRVMMAKGTELRQRITQMLGPRAGLVIKTFMATPDSPIGSYTRVSPIKAVIAMALNAKDGLSIADHEGYHAAEDSVLTAAEVRIISNALKEGRPAYEQLMAKVRAYDLANKTNLADEVSGVPAEARAYAFEFWRRGELTAEGALGRVFQKLRQFFERVANAVRGLGFTSMEDIFTALDRGQFAERQANSGQISEVAGEFGMDGVAWAEMNSVAGEQGGSVRLSEMTYDELAAAHDQAIDHNRRVEDQLIAERYPQVAQEFASWSQRKRDAWMESNLLVTDDNVMQAQYAPTELIAEYRGAVNDFDTETPRALGASIAVKARNMDQPGFFSTPDGTAVKNALRYAESQKWDMDAVLGGMRSRATQWAGNDAKEMFARLFKTAQEKPTLRLTQLSQAAQSDPHRYTPPLSDAYLRELASDPAKAQQFAEWRKANDYWQAVQEGRAGDTQFSRAALDTSISRRNFIIGTAALLATRGVGASELTLGKAKPIPAAVINQQMSPQVVKILRGNGATSLNGAKVITQALADIATNGPTEVRALAAGIAKLMPKEGVLLAVNDHAEVNAHGVVEFMPLPRLTLFTAKGRTGLTYSTFLHESLHVAVAARYRTLSSGMPRGNDTRIGFPAPAASAAMAQFKSLWDEFGNAVSKDTAIPEQYKIAVTEAERSPDEFFVRALTDANLQQYMASKPYQGKTLFERFKDWIKTSLFGFSTSGTAPSWLDAALAGANDLNAAMSGDVADFSRARAMQNFASSHSVMFSRAAVEMNTRMQAGELERVQEFNAWMKMQDDAMLHKNDTLKRVLFGPLADNMGGSISRWWQENIATPNYVAHLSQGYKNVYKTLNTYIRYRETLIEQMLRQQMPEWYTAHFADQDAAFGALLKRSVEKYTANSQEQADLYRTLTPEQQKLFDGATKMVAGFLDAELAVDTKDYKDYLVTPGAYEKWLTDRTAQVQEMKDTGYVPLRRYGDHTVRVYKSIIDKEGKPQQLEVALEMFTTEREAIMASKIYEDEMKRQGSPYTVEVGFKHKITRDTTVSVQQFLDTARRNGVDISATERERLVIALSDSGAMVRNRMLHREGMPGFSKDGMRVLNEFGVNMSGKIAYARFGVAIDSAAEGRAVTSDVVNGEPQIEIDQLRYSEDGKNEGASEFEARNLWKQDGPKSGFYRNMADKLSDYVLVPDNTGGWSRNLRGAAMMYFIGGSISGAMVNTMSVPMLLVPELSIHTGYSNALATSLGAWKQTWQHQAILRDITRLKDKDANPMPSIDNVPGLRDALIAATDKLHDTELHQIMSISQGQFFSQSRKVQRAIEVWMSPFRISEQTNRITSFISGYKIGKENGLTGPALFNFARDMVDSTQNNYSQANRPGAARNPVWAIAMMFKSFPLFMTEAVALMYKANPKSAVFMLLGLVALTGVQGLPFAETIEDLIDTIAQRIFNSPFNTRRAMRNVIKSASEAVVGYDMSELVLRGVINDMVGMSVSSRIGAGDFVPGSRLGTADADQGRILEQFAGAPYAMVKDAATSAGKFVNGVFTGDWKATADALRQGGPIAARNVLKGAQQLADGYATDSKGRKIVDVSTPAALWQMAGVSSAGVAKMYELESINIQTRAFYNQFSQDLQGQLVQALKSNDAEKVQEINTLRSEWNAQYPSMPILPNAAATRRAIVLSGVPLDQRSRMLWGRRLGGANIFTEEAGQ
jgi:hypothetical protein